MNSRRSLDHLVGSGEQRRWHLETQHLCRLEINDQIEFCRLLNGQIARLLSLENTSNVDSGLTIGFQG